ncbi:hypothetical protein ACO1PF_10060 [Alkalibacterium sp. f15]|uniref:hypothetical protein n=1 Tax=Alkalibacterium sp. f15 TaxID=3414029 RepID=UPI003BF7D307
MDYAYLLTDKLYANYKNNIRIKDYYFHYNDCSLHISDDQDSKILLMGYATDCKEPSKSNQDIADELLKLKDFDKILNQSRYLLGRFIIFYYQKDTFFHIIPDATCSIPIYYTEGKSDQKSVSSDSLELANMYQYGYSKEAIKIKNMAEEQHPLPYNLTMYDEIKMIIPNHYLSMKKSAMVRFYPNKTIELKEYEDVLDETISIIDNVLKTVIKERKLALPLTSGIDSRTLLAFLKEDIESIPMYTFFNKGDSENWDMKVPKMIAEKYHLEHLALERETISKEQLDELSVLLDKQQNRRILENGLTLSLSSLSERSFLSGDIIPILKSNFGKNLPESMATLGYLTTKTHNFSKENKNHVAKWMKDAQNEYNVSLYDLFFWEHRSGKWLPNNAKNYDVFADPYYLFNCHYLIELWVSLSRKDRVNHSFQEEIIKRKWPELLEFPINPGKSKVNALAKNQYAYYIGSFIKYYISKLKFLRKSRNKNPL